MVPWAETQSPLRKRGGREKGGSRHLTRDGLSSSVLLRDEEPAGAYGKGAAGSAFLMERLVRHAHTHTHYSQLQAPTCGALTQLIVAIHSLPHPWNSTRLPRVLSSPAPPSLGEQTFSLNPRCDGSRLADAAWSAAWMGLLSPAGRKRGRGWVGPHSWMMGASCVPRSSQ